jgi:acetyltransferase
MEPAVTIRRIVPADSAALVRFYADLSDDSRQARFMAVTRGLSPAQAASFCQPDHDHREGFVAVARNRQGRDLLVGHLCIEPDGPERAEVAIAVADAWRRRGIGRMLLAAGIDWARRAGIRQFVATMLATNVPIIRLLGSLGLPARTRYGSANVADLTIELTPAQPIAA